MQDDVIQTARIHPANRTEVFIWQNFQPALTKISGTEPASPPSHEHMEHFTKDLEVMWDLRNRASLINRAHAKRP